jgi:hypothetical protein
MEPLEELEQVLVDLAELQTHLQLYLNQIMEEAPMELQQAVAEVAVEHMQQITLTQAIDLRALQTEDLVEMAEMEEL